MRLRRSVGVRTMGLEEVAVGKVRVFGIDHFDSGILGEVAGDLFGDWNRQRRLSWDLNSGRFFLGRPSSTCHRNGRSWWSLSI